MSSSESDRREAWWLRPVVWIRLGLAGFGLVALGHALGWWHTGVAAATLPDLCAFHRLSGLDCPGCGMGRSLVHLSMGDLAGAQAMHPFGPLLLAGAVGYALFPRQVARFRTVGAVAVIALLVYWLAVKVI